MFFRAIQPLSTLQVHPRFLKSEVVSGCVRSDRLLSFQFEIHWITGENRAVKHKTICYLLALFLGGIALNLSAQGTAFMYQGQLNNNGSPANGPYDLLFELFDAPTNGNQISVPLTNLDVTVAGGLFNTTLDFGPVFTGTNYWLSIGVRPTGDTNAFTQLLPLQPILPVPYAVFATSASNILGSLSATQLSGTLPSAQIMGSYFGSVNFTNPADTFTGTYFGNGSNLTSLNGSQITAGTVADARLTTNVALLNGNQTFTGLNTFSGVSNSFTGSFFGNGLVGWIPTNGTSVQAVRDTGYLLLSSNLTTVTLPPTTNLLQGDVIRISGAGSGGWIVAQNAGQSIMGNFFGATNSTWQVANVPSAGWWALASSASGMNMVAGSSSGGTYTSQNSGQTWNAISSGTSYSPDSVASSADGTHLVGAISGQNIVLSTNSGSSWFLSGAPGTTAWTSVASSADGSRLAAVTSGGVIWTSVNSGTSWTQRTNNLGLLASIASSADGTKLVTVANSGYIYTSVNSGINWARQTSGAPFTNWLATASSSDGSKLVAVVNGPKGGGIYTSTDFGAAWTLQPNAPNAQWTAVASSADGGRLVAVNPTTGIYVSNNHGLTWYPQSVPTQAWKAVTCSADGSIMAAGYAATSTSGGIYYLQALSESTSTTTGITGSLSAGPNSAVELQYIGSTSTGTNQFMPVSSTGVFWAN